MNRPTLLRVLIAFGSILVGLVHLRLYVSTYRDVPVEHLGRAFVLNAVAAGVAAVIVLTVAQWWAVLVPLAVANLTLIAFGLSRTRFGVLGFDERGWTPSPDAAAALAVEFATASLCVVALVVERHVSLRRWAPS